LLLLTLSGCVTVVGTVANRDRIRTIAVVSAVHDTVTMRYRGLLSSHQEDAPVDWALRKRLDDRLVTTLAQTYQVKKLNEDLVPIISKETESTRGNGFAFPESKVMELVKNNTKPGQVDTIVVVFDTDGAMYTCCAGGGDYPFYAGFMYRVLVMDGTTFTLLGNDFGRVPRRQSTLIVDYDNPAIDIDIGWRGEQYASMAPSMKNTIRDDVYALIDQSVPFTLRNRLHLIP
jgi:hypothetical protein